VLQFPAEADLDAGPFAGRAEHVASGRAAHFHTLEDLRIFLARVLAETRDRDSAGGQQQA
jgi:hypothetical protein